MPWKTVSFADEEGTGPAKWAFKGILTKMPERNVPNTPQDALLSLFFKKKPSRSSLVNYLKVRCLEYSTSIPHSQTDHAMHQLGVWNWVIFCSVFLTTCAFFSVFVWKKKRTDRPSEYLGRSQWDLANHQCVGYEGHVHVTVMGWSWHLLSHSWEAWSRSNSQPGYSFMGSSLLTLGRFWDFKECSHTKPDQKVELW